MKQHDLFVSAPAEGRVRSLLGEAVAVQVSLQRLSVDIIRAAGACVEALAGQGRVLVFGNGGSAAEAQHFAAELSGRFLRNRRALAGLALTSDGSVLTAISNDFGFQQVFARQVAAFGLPADVAVGISTSGCSANVIEGLKTARAAGLTTIAVTGPDAGPMAEHANIVLAVPGSSTARIQEGHLTALHVICDLVDAALVDGLPLFADCQTEIDEAMRAVNGTQA